MLKKNTKYQNVLRAGWFFVVVYLGLFAVRFVWDDYFTSSTVSLSYAYFILLTTYLSVGLLPNIYSLIKSMNSIKGKLDHFGLAFIYSIAMLVVHVALTSIWARYSNTNESQAVFEAVVFGVPTIILGLVLNFIYRHVAFSKSKKAF